MSTQRVGTTENGTGYTIAQNLFRRRSFMASLEQVTLNVFYCPCVR
jgi:hypothetical protein